MSNGGGGKAVPPRRRASYKDEPPGRATEAAERQIKLDGMREDQQGEIEVILASHGVLTDAALASADTQSPPEFDSPGHEADKFYHPNHGVPVPKCATGVVGGTMGGTLADRSPSNGMEKHNPGPRFDLSDHLSIKQKVGPRSSVVAHQNDTNKGKPSVHHSYQAMYHYDGVDAKFMSFEVRRRLSLSVSLRFTGRWPHVARSLTSTCR
jgi:hypothetical protein